MNNKLLSVTIFSLTLFLGVLVMSVSLYFQQGQLPEIFQQDCGVHGGAACPDDPGGSWDPNMANEEAICGPGGIKPDSCICNGSCSDPNEYYQDSCLSGMDPWCCQDGGPDEPPPPGVIPTPPLFTPPPIPNGCYQGCDINNASSCLGGLECQLVAGGSLSICVNPSCADDPSCTCFEPPKLCYEICDANKPNDCVPGLSCQVVAGSTRCVNPAYPNEPSCQATTPPGCYEPCDIANPDSCTGDMECQQVNGQNICVNPAAPNEPDCVPNAYACVDLQPANPTVARPSSITFTCSASGNAGVKAEFRVLRDRVATGAGSSQTLANNQALWTYDVSNTAEPGDYLIQCRICDGANACTEWGKSSVDTAPPPGI